MGCWNYGIFDDDTAYDFEDELKNDAKKFFTSSFNKAIKSEYLEFDNCHAVTVSAAYIDNLLNGTKYRTDNEERKDESNVNCFRLLHSDLDVSSLKGISVEALEKVISDKSELYELWSDNDELFLKWKSSIKELINRLKK